MPVLRTHAGARSAMDTSTPITVAVARFEELLARGLWVVIESDTSLEMVADDMGQDRVDVILRALRPRVAILDVDALPNLATVRDLSRRHPDTRLVLVATRPTAAESAQLLAFGASACLGRDTRARDVVTAIHLASRGLQLLPRAPVESATRTPTRWQQLLTQREAEVLPLLQQGSSNAQIAAALHVSVETVRTHARNVYRKLGVGSRRELAALPARVAVEDPAEHPVFDDARRGNRLLALRQ
jgi:DNA-binding NarL/FixJ family response regulator